MITTQRGQQERNSRTVVATIYVAVMLVACLEGLPAQAVDGSVEVRSMHQEGRAGREGYETDTLWEVFSARQKVNLSPLLSLNIDGLVRREFLESNSAGVRADSERTTMSPKINLDYHPDWLHANLRAGASRNDHTGSNLTSRRDERFSLGLWFTSRLSNWILNGSVRRSVSWRYVADDDRENRNLQVSTSARWDVSPRDALLYQFTRSDQDVPNSGVHAIYRSNLLQYRGDRAFADKRGYVSVHAQSSHFYQMVETDPTSDLVYQLPLSAGYVLDDSPDFLDPLEDDPIAVPGLVDNNRETPTEINLGDNAPVVRDYGGDYRNIIVDFGDLREMAQAVLYVDRRVRFPELMTWDVYFSDEAEGRDWGATLSTSSYSVSYQEWETGRQGWVFVFEPEVVHRRLKVVNRKRGLLEPDLLVTEFEIYDAQAQTTPTTTSRVLHNRLSGIVRYQVSSVLRTWYSTNFENRDFDDNDQNLRGASHALGSDAQFDDWLVSGQIQKNTLRGETRRDTDSSSQSLFVSRNTAGRLDARLGWSRTSDRSFSAGYVTNSVSGSVIWRLAPELSFHQSASRGWRDEGELATDSRSWSLVSQIRSRPRPSLRVDLRRTDRWVDQEAGSGFTSFENSALSVDWAIAPLLGYSGEASYQVREAESDWRLRNNLVWNPLEGGSFLVGIQLNDYQDSRTDRLTRGGAVTGTWRPRPRLTLSGDINKSYERRRGERGWPLSYQLRAYWTF